MPDTVIVAIEHRIEYGKGGMPIGGINTVARHDQVVRHRNAVLRKDPVHNVVGNGKSTPRLAKFLSLSLIYKCDVNEILALFGLNVADLDREKALVELPQTHLSGFSLSPAEPVTSASLKFRDDIVLEKTNLVHRMFQGLGEMPLFLAQHAGARHVLYGYVGTEDYTLDPLIRPGAFVQIDPRQNKVVKGVWPNEHHRPIYFVELRDNLYACSWCDYEGSRLLLVPCPKSPVAIRSFRYPQDAEIVGRVTGIAMMIAQLQPDTISELPRT